MQKATPLCELKKGFWMTKTKNKFYPVSEPTITNREIEYVTKAVKSGWVSSLGEYITQFEKQFSEFVGTKYAISCSNGTVGLHLAMLSAGINSGDEVIVPDLTFVATANAVSYLRAIPVFADVDPLNWCINPNSIKKIITRKTKAIIPVHLYGYPADMKAIMKIANEFGLIVFEDAAEAHGAEIDGKRVGSFAKCGVFSFYGNKIITTGEGGMITTNDKALHDRAKYLRDHAMSKKKRYWHTEIGYNYRITNIQAALGLAQLHRIDSIIKKKFQIYHWYKKYLGSTDLITLNPTREGVKNVFWMVSIILSEKVKITRDELMKKLREKKIDSRPFFYPISQLPMYKKGLVNPVAYNISKRGMNLPSSYNLSEPDVKFISKQLLEFIKA